MVSAKVGAQSVNKKHNAQKKNILDKMLSNKRRDCSVEHLFHEQAFLNGLRSSECTA